MAPSGRGGLRRRTSNPVSPQTIGSSILPQSRHSRITSVIQMDGVQVYYKCDTPKIGKKT